jgi:hypothetical protein
MANENHETEISNKEIRQQAAQDKLAANPLVSVWGGQVSLDSSRVLLDKTLNGRVAAEQGDLGRWLQCAKDKRFADPVRENIAQSARLSSLRSISFYVSWCPTRAWLRSEGRPAGFRPYVMEK